MLDVETQLAELRHRIAQIDRKYESRKLREPRESVRKPANAARFFIEEWAQGQVVENEHGAHFQMEKLYERHRHHGSADIGALAELPHDLLDVAGNGEMPSSSS